MKKNRFVLTALAIGFIGIGGLFVSGQQAGSLREIQIHMSVGAIGQEGLKFPAARPDYYQVTIMRQRSTRGTLPRERHPELSEDHLVVMAVDGRGDEIFRTIVPDPRLLRAETADPSGQLTNVLFYRVNIDFWITLPNDPDLEKVMIFQPQWTGTAFNLVPVGEARLR